MFHFKNQAPPPKRWSLFVTVTLRRGAVGPEVDVHVPRHAGQLEESDRIGEGLRDHPFGRDHPGLELPGAVHAPGVADQLDPITAGGLLAASDAHEEPVGGRHRLN